MLRFLPSLSVPSHQCFGRTVSCPTTCGSSRLPVPSNVNLTSRSPAFSALSDVAIAGAGLRADFLERLEGEDHVLGRHRLAVVPFRLGAQFIGGGGEVVRIADGLGKQPVDARDFIERRHKQRVVQQVDALRERAFDAGDHHVEIVEGAERDLRCGAALRRLRVDVVELLEAGRIFQLAEFRHAVPPGRPRALRRGADPGRQREFARGQQDGGGREQRTAIHLRPQ